MGVCGCAHTKVVREGVIIAEVPRFLTLGWVWLLFVSSPSAHVPIIPPPPPPPPPPSSFNLHIFEFVP